MNNQPWNCPFCKHYSTIDGKDTDKISGLNYVDSSDGNKFASGIFIVCPNPECKKLTFKLALFKAAKRSGSLFPTKSRTHFWNLIPDSVAKTYSPDIVPRGIINDYEEACKIQSLSPKASATLSRRALQGMIRDFWKIKKPEGRRSWTLWNEIQAIKNKPNLGVGVWDAIDAVRKMGNIGAHMEKDVNIIIDVDPEEADKLIWLIEFLIEKWYVEKHETKLRLLDITNMAEKKSTKKKINKSKS